MKVEPCLSRLVDKHHLTSFTQQQRLGVQHNPIYQSRYVRLLLEYCPGQVQQQLYTDRQTRYHALYSNFVAKMHNNTNNTCSAQITDVQ